MKLATKILMGVTGLLGIAAQSQAVQHEIAAFLTTHPSLASLAAVVTTILALGHNPQASK